MNQNTRILGAAAALAIGAFSAGEADAAVIASFAENDNNLPNGGFGFQPGDFPQSADQGSASLELANFDTTTEVNSNGDTKFRFIESFGGTTVNAEGSTAAGGSLSIEGGTDSDPGTAFDGANNGSQILLTFDTVGFEDIVFSFAARGTGTGFTSRDFAFSTDGTNFTDVSFTGDTGALGSEFTEFVVDLSSVTALDNATDVTFRLTLDGATSSSGNNRFDNITIEGSAVPEPAALGLLGAGGLLALRRRRR